MGRGNTRLFTKRFTVPAGAQETVRFGLPSKGFLKHASLYMTAQAPPVQGKMNVVSLQTTQDDFGQHLASGVMRRAASDGGGSNVDWDGDFPLTVDLELTAIVRNDTDSVVNMKCDFAVWQP